MGGFWEAKILDFRTFFDVFWKSFLKRVPEGEKIDKKTEKDTESDIFEPGSGVRDVPGEGL